MNDNAEPLKEDGQTENVLDETFVMYVRYTNCPCKYSWEHISSKWLDKAHTA